MMFLRLLVLLALFPFAVLAQEFTPDVPLTDAVQEAQARSIFHELRCNVCEGQTIADSNAPLASDMRALVRTRVAAGDTNPQILSFFAERYGESILMRPPVVARTLPLWAMPLVMLLTGAAFFFSYFKRGGKPS